MLRISYSFLCFSGTTYCRIYYICNVSIIYFV